MYLNRNKYYTMYAMYMFEIKAWPVRRLKSSEYVKTVTLLSFLNLFLFPFYFSLFYILSLFQNFNSIRVHFYTPYPPPHKTFLHNYGQNPQRLISVKTPLPPPLFWILAAPLFLYLDVIYITYALLNPVYHNILSLIKPLYI